MKSLAVKSLLAISPAWCLTCRLHKWPSVRVHRHTQNRRRYSLNAPSQGGGLGPGRNKATGAGAGLGPQWGVQTCNYTSQRKHHLHLTQNAALKARSRFCSLCVGLRVRLLYLLYRKYVDKSPVWVRLFPQGTIGPANSIAVMAAEKLWTNIYGWPDWVLKSLFSPPVLLPFRRVSGLLPGVLCQAIHSPPSLNASTSPPVRQHWPWPHEPRHSSASKSVSYHALKIKGGNTARQKWKIEFATKWTSSSNFSLHYIYVVLCVGPTTPPDSDFMQHIKGSFMSICKATCFWSIYL